MKLFAILLKTEILTFIIFALFTGATLKYIERLQIEQYKNELDSYFKNDVRNAYEASKALKYESTKSGGLLNGLLTGKTTEKGGATISVRTRPTPPPSTTPFWFVLNIIYAGSILIRLTLNQLRIRRKIIKPFIIEIGKERLLKQNIENAQIEIVDKSTSERNFTKQIPQADQSRANN